MKDSPKFGHPFGHPLRRNQLSKVLARFQISKDWVGTIIALFALATSVWSGIETREFNRLSARPHLFIERDFATSSLRLGVVLTNEGPGMAIIDEFNVGLDGDQLPGDIESQWDEFKTATGTKDWTNRGDFPKDEAVPAGSLADILLIVDQHKFDRDKPASASITCEGKIVDKPDWAMLSSCLKTAAKRLTVAVRYHSMYGEHFEMKQQGLNPAQFSQLRGNKWVAWEP